MPISRIAILVLAIFLTGAGVYHGFVRGVLLERPHPAQKIDPNAERFARHYLATLSKSGLAGVEAMQSPATQAPSARAHLQQVAEALREMGALELVAAFPKTRPIAGHETMELAYQIRQGDRYRRTELTLIELDGQFRVHDVQVETLTESIEAQNEFTVGDRPLQNLVILAAAIMIPLFVTYVLALCVRSTDDPPLWTVLWVFFIVTGVGRITLDWTTGQIVGYALGFFFPTAKLSHPELYSHYFLSISCPLGALLYLRRHKILRLARAKELATHAEAASDAPPLPVATP